MIAQLITHISENGSCCPLCHLSSVSWRSRPRLNGSPLAGHRLSIWRMYKTNSLGVINSFTAAGTIYLP